VEAAFFDLDKTVIARASVLAFGRPLYREGLISRRTVLRALYGQLLYVYFGADEARLARLRASLLALTQGWEQARVRAITEEALESVVEPLLYAEALELIAGHRQAGRMVVLVSASPEEIVQPLARYLGIEHSIATRALVDEDGRYTGEMAFYAFGQAKVEAMQALAARHGLDLSASWAYSDSATDLPMLEAVGHPVVVNPDRALARVAAERGWEVRSFVRPVRLRGGGPRETARRAAPLAAGVALAAASGGTLLWWWRARRGEGGSSPGTALRQRGRYLTRSYSTRSFLAAMTPSAMRMARRTSFFMPAG